MNYMKRFLVSKLTFFLRISFYMEGGLTVQGETEIFFPLGHSPNDYNVQS